jgi:hypothetical protein
MFINIVLWCVVMFINIVLWCVVMFINIVLWCVVMFKNIVLWCVVMFINIVLWCVVMFINIVLWCVVMFNQFLKRTKIAGSKTQSHFLHTTLLHSKSFQCVRVVTKRACYLCHIRPSVSPHLSVRLPMEAFLWHVFWGLLCKSVEIFQIGLKLCTNIGHITWRPWGRFIVAGNIKSPEKRSLRVLQYQAVRIADVQKVRERPTMLRYTHSFYLFYVLSDFQEK